MGEDERLARLMHAAALDWYKGRSGHDHKKKLPFDEISEDLQSRYLFVARAVIADRDKVPEPIARGK